MAIQVGVVECETQIREEIAKLINESEGFDCNYTFDTDKEALEKIPSLNLDVVLITINLPDKSGICCVEILKQQCLNTQFLMFAIKEDFDSVLNAFKAGANGYILKTTEQSKILDAITDIHNGGSPMSSQISRIVVNSFRSQAKNAELQKLSIRESEILGLLAQGFRYKEIAGQLNLSTETVRTHIQHIYKKLQVNSCTKALNKAYSK